MSDSHEDPQPTSTRVQKPGKKAVWSSIDDQTLLTVLKEQKATGFQTDNGGFHNDAYKAAAVNLATSISKGPKKSSEMCKTRWGTLKKDFKAVKSIREKSGFGWDAEKCIATATDRVWEDLIKSKPKLKCWRKKKFPLYDDILDLIEGQVATGATAFFPGDPDNNGDSNTEGQQAAKDNSDGDDEKSDSDGDDGDGDGDADGDDDDNNVAPVALSLSFRTPAHQRVPSSSATSTVSSPSMTSTSRKRTAASSGVNERPAKRAHGRKPTQSDAGFEMAEAVRDLARSAMGDNVDPSALSPARRSRAIARLEEDNELSDNEMIDAFKLIRRDTTIADAYLAITSVHRRTLFIQAEIESFSC